MGLPAMGFTLPRSSPAARCALTAPFHPYPKAVYFLWHFPSARAGSGLPTIAPYPVRTFLSDDLHAAREKTAPAIAFAHSTGKIIFERIHFVDATLWLRRGKDSNDEAKKTGIVV